MWNFSELVNAFYSYPIYSIDAKITTHNKAFQLFEALLSSMFDNSNFLTMNKLCISDKYCFLYTDYSDKSKFIVARDCSYFPSTSIGCCRWGQ